MEHFFAPGSVLLHPGYLLAAIVLLGGLVSMDTTSGPQIMVSEPLVNCTALGMLFGDPVTGIQLGVLFQLLWLDYMPLGAVRFIDHDMAAFVSTASLLAADKVFGRVESLLRAEIIPAVLFGVLVGWLGLQVTASIWRWNDRRGDAITAALRDGTVPRLGVAHSIGLGAVFLKGVLMTVLFVPAGTALCGLVRRMPPVVENSFALGSLMIFGTVAASAVLFYWRNERARRPLALGSIGGIVWLIAALR